MNAANPIRTFCESFTTTPAFRAVLLIISPAATTDALVSSVPPSHAPPTASGIPKARIAHGITTIMGAATITTSDVT